jgi:hypothetical protein
MGSAYGTATSIKIRTTYHASRGYIEVSTTTIFTKEVRPSFITKVKKSSKTPD